MDALVSCSSAKLLPRAILRRNVIITRYPSRRILNHENQHLLVVERFPAWELEPGDLFECNGTVWQWGVDYSCLHILPSGWPALVHCHGIEQVLLRKVIHKA